MVASTEGTLLAQGHRNRIPQEVKPFRAALKDNALTQLRDSQARLGEELDTYADFNSPAWDELRQVAAKNNQLQEFELQAVEDLEQFISETFYGGAPFIASGTGFVFPAPEGDLAARREAILEHFQDNPNFSDENKEQLEQLIDQLDLADQNSDLRAQLQSQYPALAALGRELDSDRPNSELHEILSREYGKATKEIDGLISRIDRDPERALHLDLVRERTLQEHPEAQAWAEQQLRNDKTSIVVGTVTTAALGVGSIFFPPLALPAAVIGTATAREDQKRSEDTYDAALADIWSEEGSGLTSTELEEARDNLIGARVNLALGLVDLGWTGVTDVAKLGPQATNVLAKLDPQQVTQVLEAAQLKAAGQTEKALDSLQAIKAQVGETIGKQLDEVANRVAEAIEGRQLAPEGGPFVAMRTGQGNAGRQPLMAANGAETVAAQAQRLGQQLSDLNLPGLGADKVREITAWAAGDKKLAHAIDGLLNGGGQIRNLDDKKGLHDLAKRYAKHNQPGSLRELEVAASRVRQGHDVSFNLGADVVDHTTQEALQIKNVTSRNLEGVQNNFAKAVQQLSGKKGEVVPQRPNHQPFERIAELVINNPKNPFFAGTAEDIAKKLRKYLTDPTVFDDYPLPEGKPPSDFVDSIRITNENGTHTFEVIRDGQGRLQDIKIHEANQPRLISQRPSGQPTIVPESDSTTLATQPLTAALATAQISDFSPDGRNRAYEMVGSLIDRLKENDLQPTRLPTGDLLVLTLDGKMEISDRNGEPKFVYDHEKGQIQVSSEIHQEFLVEIGPNEPSARENNYLEATA